MEMPEIEFKRKIYDKMAEWKEKRAPDYALFLKGARCVGKFKTFADGLASKANKNIKFKDLDGYNSYNMLHEIHNFLKHNSIDAYTKLKNDYPKKGKWRLINRLKFAKKIAKNKILWYK